MHADIEFIQDWFAEVQDKGAFGRLRQVAFRKGTRVLASVRVIDGGIAQLADLCMADGSTAVQVPLSCFAVVGKTTRAA